MAWIIVRNRAAALLGLSLGCGLLGCGSSQPIVIETELQPPDYQWTACPRTGSRFFVEDAVDKRGYARPEDIGFTQTGLFNRQTGLESRPLPAALLTRSLSTFLRWCGELSDAAESADSILKPSLLVLQVTERTRWNETLTVTVRYDNEVIDRASQKRLGRITSSGEAIVSGSDTTGHAGRAMREAIAKSLEDFSRQLAKLAGRS